VKVRMNTSWVMGKPAALYANMRLDKCDNLLQWQLQHHNLLAAVNMLTLSRIQCKEHFCSEQNFLSVFYKHLRTFHARSSSGPHT
jgi:hypothetical protein